VAVKDSMGHQGNIEIHMGYNIYACWVFHKHEHLRRLL